MDSPQKSRLLKKALAALAIAGLSAALVGAAGFWGPLEVFERKMFDARVQFGNVEKGHDDIVLVMIDEASLQSMKDIAGRWPWNRALYADLLEFLALGGAKTVMFDILFTEPQTPRDEAGELGEEDMTFAAASADSGAAYHAVQFVNDTEDESNKDLLNRPLPDIFTERFGLTVEGDPSMLKSGNNVFYLPLAELYENSAGIGVVEFSADSDDVYRRTGLIREYRGNYFPVLSLVAYLGAKEVKTIRAEKDALYLDDLKVPLIEGGNYLVNPHRKFNTISIGGLFASYQRIQRGETENLLVHPDIFKDKIVFVGASAVGLEDLKPTSQDSVPGVFLHASIVSNLLERKFVTRPPFWVDWLAAFSLAFFTAGLILGRLPIVVRGLLPFVIGAVFVQVTFVAFDHFNLWLGMVFPVTALLASHGGSFAYMTFTEGRETRKTRKILAQYVSPGVLSEVLRSESSLHAEIGAKEELTVLFSDIRGFTTFSENTPPEQVVEMLNYYLERMIDIVFSHKGTLDKFIGDAVMAFWGAPLRTDDHALESVKAALDMVKKLDEINRDFKERNYPLFRIGVGLNTGQVILGNIGSEKKLDYTVIGDNVNLASRLEGLTKVYGCDVLIAESTYRRINAEIACRLVDQVRVKGKHLPIRVYNPVALASEAGEDVRRFIETAEQAFREYQAKNWSEALALYEKLLEKNPEDGVSRVFKTRCEKYREEGLPKNWDGSYNPLTK